MAPAKTAALCLLQLLLQCDINAAHVVLTFPPARWPPFDFLDNTRTPLPCGVPKSKDHVERQLRLFGGERYNVTWHMAYVHGGSYKLELLDSAGALVAALGSPFPAGGQFVHSSAVRLPAAGCDDCIIRLVRQATEWGNYEFHSCADVTVVAPQTAVALECNDRGAVGATGACEWCSVQYAGPMCEYDALCEPGVAGSCENGGECAEEAGRNPRYVCYCPPPYFGQWCEKESVSVDGCITMGATALADFMDATCFDLLEMGESYKFYYRRAAGELEMVAVAPSPHWFAVGWRPELTDQRRCYQFPVDATGHDAKAEPEPEPNAEPEPGAEPQPEPEPEAEPAASAGGGRRLSFDEHNMNCMDMVVAQVAASQMTRIGDYYSRDRSSPLHDSVLGGTDDLTAAVFRPSRAAGGETFLYFRKAINAEPTDHSAFVGDLTFVWASGGAGADEQGDTAQPSTMRYHKLERGATVVRMFEPEADGADALHSRLLPIFVLALVVLVF